MPRDIWEVERWLGEFRRWKEEVVVARRRQGEASRKVEERSKRKARREVGFFSFSSVEGE